MLRELVRTSDRGVLLAQARRQLDRLADDISSIARDDHDSGGAREKAAEFVVYLRARQGNNRTLTELIDRVAEATAKARYRSGRIVDYLLTWLFIEGEQFITSLSDTSMRLDLEVAHPTIWNRFRFNILEVLEAGAQRMAEGRRFRLCEQYQARFRLVRARNDERFRGDELDEPSPADAKGEAPDFVAAMVVDLFALSLTEIQQNLIVAQIPSASGGRVGLDASDMRRLWAPLRAARIEQGYENWARLRHE